MTVSSALHYMLALELNMFPALLLIFLRARSANIEILQFVRFTRNGKSVATLCAYGAISLVVAILSRSIVNAWLAIPESYHAPTTQEMRSIAQVLPVTSIIFGILIAALEEVIFRGWLITEVLEFCRRTRGILFNEQTAAICSVVITAAIFAVAHASSTFFLSFMVVGLVLGAARILTDSLLPSLIAHVAMNLLAGLSAIGWI